MNTTNKIRDAFRRATPNVTGGLPQVPVTKKRRRLSDRAVHIISTAASVVLVIGAALYIAAYIGNLYGPTDPSLQQGQPTFQTNPSQTDPKPTETEPLPTDPPKSASPGNGDGVIFICTPFEIEWLSGFFPEADFSDCIEGYTYYLHDETQHIYLLCADALNYDDIGSTAIQSDTLIYYVKKSEPTNIYRVMKNDFTNHELVYTAPGEFINCLAFNTHEENNTSIGICLDFKKFYTYDPQTDTETFYIEVYYLVEGYLRRSGQVADDMPLSVSIYGQPTETDRRWYYDYVVETEEMVYHGDIL